MNSFDLEIAARTVWMEARGEGHEGMLAVAWVIANRHRSGHFGATLAQVCLAPLQFSCWNTSDPNRKTMAGVDYADPLLSNCRAVVQQANDQAGSDPTSGATYYCTQAIVANVPWAKHFKQTAHIGSQVFFTP